MGIFSFRSWNKHKNPTQESNSETLSKTVTTHPKILRRTEKQQEYRKQLYKDLTKYRSKGDLGKELAKDLLATKEKSTEFKESKQGITKSQVLKMFSKQDSDAITCLYKLEKKEIEEIEIHVINDSITDRLDMVWGYPSITQAKISQAKNIMKNTKNWRNLVHHLVDKITTLSERSHSNSTGYIKYLKEIFSCINPEDIKDILSWSFDSNSKARRNSLNLRWYLISIYMNIVSVKDQKEIIDILYKNQVNISNYQNQICSENKKYAFKNNIFIRGLDSITQENRKVFSPEERKEIYEELIKRKKIGILVRSLELVDEDFHQTILDILWKQGAYGQIVNNIHKRKRIIIDKNLWKELINKWYGGVLRDAIDKTPQMFSE